MFLNINIFLLQVTPFKRHREGKNILFRNKNNR